MKPADHTSYFDEVNAHLDSFSGNIPTHRSESKRKYSFNTLPFDEQLAIWNALWLNPVNWYTRLHAYFFLEWHIKNEEHLKAMWPTIVNWQNQVDDWPLCDSLSKIYTRILEIDPETVYAQLQQWNADKDLWKRRQSLVSLLYYSRTKKQFLPFEMIEQLITPLLSDKEYYVQKGLGWTLRELHNVYPQQTIPYLQTHIKQVSPIAFTIAIEKLDVAAVSGLKELRKLK